MIKIVRRDIGVGDELFPELADQGGEMITITKSEIKLWDNSYQWSVDYKFQLYWRLSVNLNDLKFGYNFFSLPAAFYFFC